MSTPLSAYAVVAALKAEGIDVQEYSNWRTHNRNHVGAWGPVYGVMIHHTVTSADDSSVALCYNGHSSLPGPLCHGVGRNDGRIALVGHGRANHAGSGDGDVLQAVINETALPVDNEANTDGNRSFYGLEIVNLGNGTDVYPVAQYIAAVKWATAHCRAHGWTANSVIGHKEWQPGKIDPLGPVEGLGDFSMNTFRRDVKAALALPVGVWPNEEEKVALTQQEKQDIANLAAEKVWATSITNRFRLDAAGLPRAIPASVYLEYGDGHYDDLKGELGAVKGGLAAVEQKVDSIALAGVDLDALAVKVADEIYRRMAQ